MATPDLLTTSVAAKLLGVSDDALRRWVEQRKIRHIRLPSGQIRFQRADIEAILDPVEIDAAEVIP